ncbi:hypothetical protein PMAYCL1PPCAC_13973, partial [Pristionchus mayeri]
AFDVMYLILESAHHSHVKLALNILKSEHSNCLQLQNNTELSMRHVMYGIVESLHVTLLYLMEKRIEKIAPKELSKLPCEILNSSASIQLEPKEEPIEDLFSIPDNRFIDDEIKNEDGRYEYVVSY